jgi:dipeptidyl aminopeptidase/acylaminoacyl peptidase
MAVEDVFRVASVSSPAVSPDGRLVAYVVSTRAVEGNESRSDVWMVPTDGGDPRRMTWAEASASSPAFSPDGRALTFLAARGDDAETQVWSMPLDGGEARPITSVEQGVSGFAWAPDGGRLALRIRDAAPERGEDTPRAPWVIDRLQFKRDYAGYLDRRRTHVFVYDLGSDSLTRLTEGDYDYSSIAWGPGGDRLAFVANRTDEPDSNYDDDVWIVTVPSDGTIPTPVRVSPGEGSDGGPVWSPDGSMIAWQTSLRPDIGGYAMSHLAVASPGGEPRVLTESLDRSISSLRFAPDGRRVLGILETEGAEHLVSVAVDGSGAETLIGGDRSVRAFEPLPDGGVAAVVSTADRPAELWRMEQEGQLRRLTHHNDELMAELSLGSVVREHVMAPDGTGLDAFYTFPPDVEPSPAGASPSEAARELPTILWIHGGPMGQDGWAWHALRQVFAARGYLVIQPNYRGSHGYGQDFALGLWQDWGGPERVDVIAAVDHAVERGWADPERLGVGGWSYGGITTNSVITHTERFKAAISGAGAALYVAAYGHDQYQRWYEQELGLPWENRELWDRISTFWNVDRITTPTLWMGGERDWNVPISQGELMYQSMKRLGRETLLVVYPGQSHGGFPPVYEADRYRRFLGWFGRYLLGDDRDWPGAA